MSFQTQTSPMRSTFQGNPLHRAPAHTRRAPRAQVRVQALGAVESLPAIFTAMKIGFAYAAVPGVIKGVWDVKQAMKEPNPQKPLTDANKQIIVANQATRYGATGALMGLSTGVLATQFGLAPDTAWQAGTVTGLCLYAVIVGVGKQIKPNMKPLDKSPAKNIDRPAEPSANEVTDLCDEDQCELPENWDDAP